jgi:hypothetical protein
MAVLLALPTRRRAAFAYAGINAKGFATSMYQGTSAEWSDFHVLLRIGRNPIFLFSQRRWFGFHPTMCGVFLQNSKLGNMDCRVSSAGEILCGFEFDIDSYLCNSSRVP